MTDEDDDFGLVFWVLWLFFTGPLFTATALVQDWNVTAAGLYSVPTALILYLVLGVYRENKEGENPE